MGASGSFWRIPAMNPQSRRQFLSAAVCSAAGFSLRPALAQEAKPYRVPKCTVTPQSGHEAAFALGGKESARWHFGGDYPRPHFFPLNGPSGIPLTRMGHPGAPDHDHHQSVWFAHHDVDGVTFWANKPGGGRIRQKDWLCYEDGDGQALMAVRLGWFAGEPERELMEHTLVVVNRAAEEGGHTLELQSVFRAVKGPVKLGKTNFGILAVRVAKSISAVFGGGELTDAEGRSGEPAIFGKRAMWMDYSGPVADGVVEGVTFFDHPRNPRSPTHWHVRADGWMGASFCMAEAFTIAPDSPLQLRYLLHAHRGGADKARAAKVLVEFEKAPLYEVVPSRIPHRQFEARAVGMR